MKPSRILIPSSIGSAAAEKLAGARQAQVLAATSRGAFVQLDESGLIFLSTEGERGPLTLNFDRLPNLVGEHAGPVEASVLRLGEVEIRLGGVEVWQPSPPPVAKLQGALPGERLRDIGLILLGRQNPSPYCLLPAALGVGGDPADRQAMQAARASLAQNQVETLVHALGRFAGRGVGLTPAGDDLLAGLLLALNRWGPAAVPEFPIREFNARLLEMTGPRISHLSAALLACAAGGLADERLVGALDSLFSGEPAAAACAARLAGWGSSSGGEALAGMSLLFPLGGSDLCAEARV